MSIKKVHDEQPKEFKFSTENLKKVEEILKKNSVHFDEIGEISNEDLYFDDKTKVSIDELYISNNNWLTNYMSS